MFCTHLNPYTVKKHHNNYTVKTKFKNNFNINSYSIRRFTGPRFLFDLNGLRYWNTCIRLWRGKGLLKISNFPHHGHNNHSQKQTYKGIYAILSWRSKITLDSRLFMLMTSISAANEVFAYVWSSIGRQWQTPLPKDLWHLFNNKKNNINF